MKVVLSLLNMSSVDTSSGSGAGSPGGNGSGSGGSGGDRAAKAKASELLLSASKRVKTDKSAERDRTIASLRAAVTRSKGASNQLDFNLSWTDCFCFTALRLLTNMVGRRLSLLVLWHEMRQQLQGMTPVNQAAARRAVRPFFCGQGETLGWLDRVLNNEVAVGNLVDPQAPLQIDLDGLLQIMGTPRVILFQTVQVDEQGEETEEEENGGEE